MRPSRHDFQPITPEQARRLTTALLLALITLALLVLLPTDEPRQPAAIVGTDLFWSYHDDLFPSHYGQDGFVSCTEAQANRELQEAGIRTEE